MVKLSASNAGGVGSIPGQGAEIPHDQEKKKIKVINLKEFGKFMNHSKNYSNHQKELFKKQHHSPNKGAVTIR